MASTSKPRQGRRKASSERLRRRYEDAEALELRWALQHGVGGKLRRALDKAQKGGPGTWNHRTAWLMAEDATKELGTVVDVYLPAKALITASGERLLRKR